MSSKYTPPSVWQPETENGGQWSSINRPESGARHQTQLPKGTHPFQLYSMATPNGQKATIMLEELLALGVKEAEYDAHLIKIGEGDQFGSDFVAINPNSKIPALVDQSTSPAINIFESGHILVYLADKFNQLIPDDPMLRVQVMNWLFWLQGSAPYLGGGFGHFYSYAPEKHEYPINRFTMETKRQLDLLDKQLANHPYIAGSSYSIADIAIWAWYGNLALGRLYDAARFLDISSYTHLLKWAKKIDQREAVQRGRIVNRFWGEEWEQVPERHSAIDIDKVIGLKS
jgi:GST-like protein